MKASVSKNSLGNLRFEFLNYFGFPKRALRCASCRISDFGFKKGHVSWRLGGKGFTLIELVVAIALLVMVIGLTGVIFQNCIGSYRAALAQAEIMQKLRVITGQLDSDFRGLRKDAPMFIWFQLDPNDPGKRLDQIMFFAVGDFQGTMNPIVGNVARIQYSLARSYDPRYNALNDPVNLRDYNRLIAKRQHILTADPGLEQWPDSSSINFAATFDDDIPVGSGTLKNDVYEYDWLSLTQWQALANDSTIPLNVDQIINICFNNRPVVNTSDANTLHLLMLEGVGSFSVQWSYMFTNAGQTSIFWWPSIDPDGNPLTIDSDFTRMMADNGLIYPEFGICFNVAAPSVPGWFLPNRASGSYFAGGINFFPAALKFTFTLYDSRGIFKDGQTFTHIVYIGE